jgi:hypothetical protein
LDEDIAHGIVNVPGDVVTACGVADFPSSARQLRTHPAFLLWVQQESEQCLRALGETDRLLPAWPNQKDPGLRVLRIFTHSMRDFFMRRARKLYPEAYGASIHK